MYKKIALIGLFALAVAFSGTGFAQNDPRQLDFPQLSDQHVSDVTKCLALASLVATVATERGDDRLANAAIADARALTFIALTQRSKQQVRALAYAHVQQFKDRFKQGERADQIVGSTFRQCQNLINQLKSKFENNM